VTQLPVLFSFLMSSMKTLRDPSTFRALTWGHIWKINLTIETIVSFAMGALAMLIAVRFESGAPI